jgi:CyaY protein
MKKIVHGYLAGIDCGVGCTNGEVAGDGAGWRVDCGAGKNNAPLCPQPCNNRPATNIMPTVRIFYSHKMDGRDYMTESEFNELANAVFMRIEQVIDASGADIDCNLNGAVLELEFEDGSKIIINRHTPNREIWLAAKSGGFHYAYQDGRWHSHRDGSELFGKLGELIKLGCDATVTF